MMDRTRYRWIPSEWPEGVEGGPWKGKMWELWEGNIQVGYLVKYSSEPSFPTESVIWLRSPHTVSHETMNEAAKTMEDWTNENRPSPSVL